jgi:acylphosphatase
MPKQRLDASFSGHVQGVGFRFTALDVAARFPTVTGFVRNTPDARVEIVAEGEPETLNAFINAVQRSMAGYIHSVETYQTKATGEFTNFTIRR